MERIQLEMRARQVMPDFGCSLENLTRADQVRGTGCSYESPEDRCCLKTRVGASFASSWTHSNRAETRSGHNRVESNDRAHVQRIGQTFTEMPRGTECATCDRDILIRYARPE